MTGTRRSFGSIRRLPSKRYQASYIGPDLARHVAPEIFTAKVDAEGWIAAERRLVEWDEWTSPEVRRAKALHDDAQTLRVYATTRRRIASCHPVGRSPGRGRQRLRVGAELSSG